MRYTSLALISLAGTSLFAGCSGGGGSGSGMAAPIMQATTAPTTAPTIAPTAAPQSTVLQTQSIDGGAAFVTASDFPVYTFDGDGTDVSNCTGACLQAWPAVTPPPGTTLTSPWSSFTRSDNGTKQLAYNGAPLYTFSGDSPGVSNGNGSEGFSLARPAASATAPPTQNPTAMPYLERRSSRN